MKQGEACKLDILAKWLVHGLPVLWADPMFDTPSGDDLKNLRIIYSAEVNGFQKFLYVVDGHEKTDFFI